MIKNRINFIVKYFNKNIPGNLKYTCFYETINMIKEGNLSVKWLDSNNGVNFKQVHRQLLKIGDLESKTWEGVEYLEKTIPEHFKTSTYQIILENITETPFKNRGFDNDKKLFELRDILLKIGIIEYRAKISKELDWPFQSEIEMSFETQFPVINGLESQLKSNEHDIIETLEDNFSQIYSNSNKLEERYLELKF